VKLKRKCLPLKSPWQNNSLENVLRRTTKGAADFEKGLEAVHGELLIDAPRWPMSEF
jgi:hypothetical protein